MNKLEEARRQLGPFNFENLPLDRNDGIWAELRSPPYSLDLEELSALKNARCTPAPGADVGLVLAVQQLSHVVHELRESTVICFQSLNESITNLARKIPSPTQNPEQLPIFMVMT